jgi:hypothetical protein
LANSQATGTPIICAREAGYIETAAGGEVLADTQEEVRRALDMLTPSEERRMRSFQLLLGAPSLDEISSTYLSWLEQFAR